MRSSRACCPFKSNCRLYRAALSLDATSHDVVYNLSLALIDLGELDYSTEMSSYSEAKTLLEQLIEAQLAALSTQSITESPEEDLDENMQVEETQTVVPSTVIESLLAYIDLLSTMLSIDPSDLTGYTSSIEEALSKANELDAWNHYDSSAIKLAEANAALSIVEASFYATSSLDSTRLDAALASLRELHQAGPTNLEVLSDLADGLALAASLLYSAQQDSFAPQATASLEAYSRLTQALSSPFTKKSAPAHTLNSILASAYCQSSFLSLLGKDGAAALHFCNQAIEATATGVYYDASKQAYGRKAGGRTDWPSERALQLSTLTLLRASFYSQNDLKPAMDLLQKLRLKQSDVQHLIASEFEDDALWSSAETAFWTDYISKLPSA